MLEEPDYVSAVPLGLLSESQRDNFESVSVEGWPELGSRMMPRYVTGHDMANGWVVVQSGVYQYAVIQGVTMQVQSVI